MSVVLEQTQYYDKYSRYDYELGRRENWEETVTRVTKYLFSFDKNNVLTPDEKWDIFQAIVNKDVMPSMRNLAMAGPAAERNNICSYNCAYGVPDDLYFFYEAVLILMSGTGLGYSVEKKYTEKLPEILPKKDVCETFSVPDDTEGWAEAVYFAIKSFIRGISVQFDYSQIRPSGSPLKTKGGRASGPDQLRVSIEKIEELIEKRRSSGYLRPIDVHDIMCHIAKCIVSGGVRRSAMIALFDYDDKEMLTCKNPENVVGNEQRYLSNNSAVFENRKTLEEMRSFMKIVFDSNAGEPGIFSRHSIFRTLPTRRKHIEDFGTNPCAEIVLRPFQFCNLSSVVCRPGDLLDDLKRKVRLATIIGTLQSMADYFPGLRPIWKKNQEEERLLGVDLNGIMDCSDVRDEKTLIILRSYAVYINKIYAEKLGINPSASVTTIKPSGNSSVFLNTSPGIHSRWSDYYIRRMQLNRGNPILPVLQMYGVPTEPSNYLPETFVAEFPVKAPDHAITNGTLSAIEQLENWKMFKENWTEHNPSCTIGYQEHERDDIIKWLYLNQNVIGGLSFLPKSDAVYEQMPYEKISREMYDFLVKDFPTEIDWNTLHALEEGDHTNATQSAACTSEKCLI